MIVRDQYSVTDLKSGRGQIIHLHDLVNRSTDIPSGWSDRGCIRPDCVTRTNRVGDDLLGTRGRLGMLDTDTESRKNERRTQEEGDKPASCVQSNPP